MSKPAAKASKQQKTKECSLYGFLVQEKANNNALNSDANLTTPYAKLVQFCTFLVSNGHPKGHQVKFRDIMTMYEPKHQEKYWKVGQLITHQKISYPSAETIPQDRISDMASTMQTEFEQAQADQTGSSGVYSQSNMLKLFNDQLQKQSEVTIKKCHQLRGAKPNNQGRLLTEMHSYNDDQNTDHSTKLMEDITLRLFLEGSGFRRRSTKQLFGEEFKFILNDYPNVCKNAVTASEVRTVKLRIYKVFHQVKNTQPMNYGAFYRGGIQQPSPQLTWKEYNILEELFEGDSSDQEEQQNPQPTTKGQDAQIIEPINVDHQHQQNYQQQQYLGDNNQQYYGGQGNNNAMMQHGGGAGNHPQSVIPGHGDNYSQRHGGGNYSASQPSIFELERSQQQHYANGGNEEFKSANMPDQGNNQNAEMAGAGGTGEPDNGLSKLDLYHVELTGMCTDQEQSDYTKMLAEFAQKFSSFVELAPTSLKAINGQE